MPICVIFNPTARGDKARHLRRHLDEIASQCELKPTWGPGAASTIATEAVRDGFDTIVAAGGDGTVNEVLNGIAAAPDGFGKARLGVIPLGTVNVLAKEHGIPVRLRPAWQTILHGRELPVDIGSVEFTQTKERRLFVQLAGAGLDARAIELVNWELKKKVSQLAYIVAGLKALREQHPLIECRCAEGSATGELVLIGHGQFYGGKLPVFAGAVATDGLMDVCVFPKVKWPSLLRYAPGVITGKVYPPPDMVRFRTARLELTSPASVPFEVEGDLAGRLPVTITAERQRLRLLIP